MRTLVAVVLVLQLTIAVAILNGVNLVEAGPKAYLSAEEIQETAKGLESAELLSNDISSEMQQKRVLMLYSFARPPKSVYANEQLDLTDKVSNDFKFKAYEYVRDNGSAKKNWFINIKNVLGPIIPMKNIAKKYPFLQDVISRYERDAMKGKLTIDDVDCDIVKFKLTQLYNIYFILQTDIKYMIIGDQHILNRAIYEQLKADKFSSPHNYYEIHELNNRQKSLLEKYFSDHVNLLVTNVGDSVDHYYNPGEFIIGRLLDSCQAVNQFQDMWKNLESSRSEICSKSNSDTNQRHFIELYNRSKYDDISLFCKELFEAM